MKEMDNMWTQLFQDKPIPQGKLVDLQTQIMAQVLAQPVDFGETVHLEARRKWGMALAIGLMVVGLSFTALLWYRGDLVYQALDVLLGMLSGLPFVFRLQQLMQHAVQEVLLLHTLRMGLSLMWQMVSWPLLGVLSVIVLFRSGTTVRNEKPIV